MLIETTVQKKETVTKEVSLPYYSSDGFAVSFCITENQDVIRVANYSIGEGVMLFKKGERTKAEYLDDAVAATPISQEEFEANLEKAVNYMDESLSAVVARRMSRENACVEG